LMFALQGLTIEYPYAVTVFWCTEKTYILWFETWWYCRRCPILRRHVMTSSEFSWLWWFSQLANLSFSNETDRNKRDVYSQVRLPEGTVETKRIFKRTLLEPKSQVVVVVEQNTCLNFKSCSWPPWFWHTYRHWKWPCHGVPWSNF
jgi:hypothetical protein